jgi:hypothetical protein
MQNINAEVCTKVIKPVKYSIQSGEDFYSILKNFELNPVMGAGGSLEELQRINNLQGQTSVQAGTEILIPFKCEEQILGWRVIDRGQYRLITSTRIEKLDSTGKKVKSESMSPDAKTKDILNKAMPGEEGVDLDEVKGDNTDISDALRYRMICEGEWTGTECIARYSALYLTGAAWYNRYDGVDKTTGGSGTLLSKLNPEVGFGWTNYWNNNWRTDLGVSIINNDIQPEVRNVPIEQGKKVLNTVTADVRYESGRWGGKLGLTQRDRLFYRFNPDNIFIPDDGGVVVNAVPIIDYHVGVSYMVKQMGKFRFDTELTFLSLTSTNTSGYVVQPGTAFQISGTITHDRVKEYLFGTVLYESSQQNTDILLQKTSELGFKFGYAWKLKDW